MRVVIIGSKGFIGQHLTSYFKDLGYEVWGADVVVDYENNQTYFLIDTTNSDYNSIFEKQSYDLCVNCSGAASVPDSLSNPLRDYFLNTVIVFKILEAIRKFQPDCKFINLSSAAVYGNPKSLPVSESSELNPLSPYGIHKLQAEIICREFTEHYYIKTCSLRIFSAYGTGLKKQLFWDLYKKAEKGVPFKLFGTGNESRDYINILDLVKAIRLVYEHSDFEADVINLGNGEEVFIKDVASLFYSFFNKKIEYSFSTDKRKGDPVNWKADIGKLKSYGYVPSIDLNTGLKKYYDWVKDLNNN